LEEFTLVKHSYRHPDRGQQEPGNPNQKNAQGSCQGKIPAQEAPAESQGNANSASFD